MPTNPIRQLDFDAAVREVVARADRPSDVNRLVAAAVRLRGSSLALHDANPTPAASEPGVRTTELGVLAAASELAGGRASQNRVIEAHEALVAARSCSPGPRPDADQTGRRWTLDDGPIEGVSLTLPDSAGDESATVWLDLPADSAMFPDQAGLGVDQAAQLADRLHDAVAAARTLRHTWAAQPGPAPTCDVEPWCTGTHGEHQPDVRDTWTPRLHTRRLPSGRVTLGRMELAAAEQPGQPGDQDTVIWLGRPGSDVDDELTIDEAAELAADLAAGVRLARGAATTVPCTFCGRRLTGRELVDHLPTHYEVNDGLGGWTPAMLDRLGVMVDDQADERGDQ
ncbi:hypothetical protein [Nakamurella sp.]|uniref:hypothetical protein n=1 Tax=Nakamurella sp. TaxID=1869182 RepID=UPI0037834853